MLVLAVLDAGKPGMTTLPLPSAVSTVTLPSEFLITTRPPGGALISTSAANALTVTSANDEPSATAISLRLKGVVMIRVPSLKCLLSLNRGDPFA
jgi:hypothetical protein